MGMSGMRKAEETPGLHIANQPKSAIEQQFVADIAVGMDCATVLYWCCLAIYTCPGVCISIN